MSLAQALFNPSRIALIGGSTDPTKLTARVQVYLRRHGFAGKIYPVHPHAAEVLGEPAYPTIAAIPDEIDFAYILVNTARVESAVAACAAKNIPVACILADGFAEAGPAGQAMQTGLLEAAQKTRLFGPNSMGIINIPARTACSVNAALAAENLIPGRWSLISQSGSMMGTLLSRAAARGQGFAKIIGTGNEADLGLAELLELLVEDPETDTILLFLETIRNPERVEAAARRAHAAGKPIIAYKLGRSQAGAVLATTHTGALAGSDAAADAFFRACGIIRVDLLETLLELPPLLLGCTPIQNPKRAVRIVTTTGGGGAMVVDRLGMANIATAHMTDTTLAGAGRDFVAKALTEARNAQDCDIAIAVIGSSAQFHPQDAVAGVIASSGRHPLAAFLLPEAPASLNLLAEAKIAAFRTPESCADAIRAYLAWRQPRTAITPTPIPAITALLPAPPLVTIDEPAARKIFAALGIKDHAIQIDPDNPPALAYPVALKAIAPNLHHKTEAGAVALNLPSQTALKAAAAEMRTRIADPKFIAQPMAQAIAEAIVGYRRDPITGPIILLGSGGILAELIQDTVLRLAPVSLPEAQEMIAECRGLATARGYRNQPPGDLDALAQAIVAVSQLAGVPEILEAEINPLIIETTGVVMADALVVGLEKEGLLF